MILRMRGVLHSYIRVFEVESEIKFHVTTKDRFFIYHLSKFWTSEEKLTHL